MSNSWFRFYNEVLNDRKVQSLADWIFKIWVNCLCLASMNETFHGNIGTIDDVSYALRETKERVTEAFHTLVTIGILVTENETFHLAAWKKRQFKSDSSTERVRKHRERSTNVTVTPQIRSDQIQIRTDQSDSVSNEKKGSFKFSPTDETHAKVLAIAPGWDRQALYTKFSEWIASGKEPPTDPQKAFLGWVPKFTADKKRAHYATN